MEDAIRKATVLIEAMPYIRAFRDKVFVIKFGGAAMEDPATLECVLDDVMFLETVGVKPVLVHGGGPAISREMKKRRIEPTFIHGHRVTTEETIEIVRDVLANQINASICRILESMDGRATPFTDPDNGALRAKRRIARETLPTGRVEEYDMGLVGDMVGIDRTLFREALDARTVPVVAPLAQGPDGETLNVNADMVAASVAAGLRAEKAVFLTDIHGIMTDPNDPASLASTLTATQIENMIADGTISGGMLPKVAGCRAAIAAGVSKAHIIDGRGKHALLLEIFTRDGVGTQIIH